MIATKHLTALVAGLARLGRALGHTFALLALCCMALWAGSATALTATTPTTPTATTLTLSAASVSVAQATTLTATVSPSKATGTVTFKDGTTTIGTATLSAGGGAGVAKLSTSFATVAAHSLTAIYAGAASYATSTSAAKSQAVTTRSTTTTLSASTLTTTVGQAITLTAKLNPVAASGTVTFKDGSTVLGTGTLVSGATTLSTRFTIAGTHSLSASYAGAATYAASTSATLSETVTDPSAPLPGPPNASPPHRQLHLRRAEPTHPKHPGPRRRRLQPDHQHRLRRPGTPSTLTDPANGATQLSYDGLGRVITVTDPRSLSTQTPRDGLGQVTQLYSPDTGNANLTYDLVGNLLTRTDSRGVLASTSYDALNRVTGTTFTLAGQAAQTYTWTYDETGTGNSYGIGRLTTASFPEGSTHYAYDPQGRVVSTVQTVKSAPGTSSQNIVHTTRYAYDAAGHITSLTYPSGRVVSISYAGGLPTGIALAASATSSATPVPLLSNIQYAPFGAVQSWTWQMASGPQAYARSFDTSGRLTRYPLASVQGDLLRDVTYDDANRITAYTHYRASVGATKAIPAPELDQHFSYDANGRLTQASVATPSAVTSWTYTYDANGNRTSVALNGNPPGAYTVDTASNRLNAVSKPPITLAYDAAGNTISDGNYTLGYNVRGRLASVAISTNQSTYSHDSAGQRVRKFSNSGANSTVLYNYDQSGHLLGEYDQNGNPIREYLWLDDQPVAVFTPDPAAGANTTTPLVYYIFADHLNTPRAVVDGQNKLRWSWMDEPFGTTAANSNPTGVGTFIMSLRFPGQVYDAESGLHYNQNRDYVPGIGRYAQSDPIGLNGGINTYSYVGGNPLSFIDPLGLYTEVVVWQGVGIGSSSFGHVSTNVNGQNFSWGPGGWDKQSATAAEYNKRQQDFRGGTGVMLNLSPQQEAALASCMRASTAAYSAISNNCGNPVQQCLNAVGAGVGYSMLPSSILENLRSSPNSNGNVSYPSPRPGSGFGGGLQWR